MPEIFIAETGTADEKELRQLAAVVEDLEQIAAFAEWFDAQSDTVKDLGRELLAIQEARGMNPRFQLDTEERYGKPIFIARCGNGRHESRQSPEHAMFLMVDSFRTRGEDRPETHARVMGMHGCTIKDARRISAALAADLRVQQPGISGEARDMLFESALDEKERFLVERRSAPPKESGTPRVKK
jgi:hypothetical protein